jgi:hypothetical protein
MRNSILGDKVVSVLLQCANALLQYNEGGEHTQLINEARLIANDIDRGV